MLSHIHQQLAERALRAHCKAQPAVGTCWATASQHNTIHLVHFVRRFAFASSQAMRWIRRGWNSPCIGIRGTIFSILRSIPYTAWRQPRFARKPSSAMPMAMPHYSSGSRTILSCSSGALLGIQILHWTLPVLVAAAVGSLFVACGHLCGRGFRVACTLQSAQPQHSPSWTLFKRAIPNEGKP